MAVVHYQFESIHPFYDGNGRTGRIINVLYLVLKKCLDIPILYLSSYIIKNKADYYRLLQEVRETDSWEDWILYMIEGVRETSLETIELIERIKKLMRSIKKKIKEDLPNVYSKELLDILFTHPYTKINFITKSLNISRQTASNYLNSLTKAEILTKIKIGRSNYYINIALYNLFTNN